MNRQSEFQPIKTAIIGLGRGGYGVHLKALLKLQQRFDVVAVADTWPERADAVASEIGAKAYRSLVDLFSEEFELAVIATPNNLHTECTLTAIENGRHVVCDKPFGLTSLEARSMVDAANAAGVHISAFFSRRFESTFLKIAEVLRSGVLGDVVHMRMDWGEYARRWDWQTLTEFGGGQLNNNFPHALDQALLLVEAATGATEHSFDLFADVRRTHGIGDAEDHVRVTLRDRLSGITIDIEQPSTNPYPGDRWSISATRGGLRGDASSLEWKWLPSVSDRLADSAPNAERTYCKEEMAWETGSFVATNRFGDWQRLFYENVYSEIREGLKSDNALKRACVVAQLVETIRERGR